MKIEILGPGCKRCDQLYENTLTAVAQLNAGGSIQVEKIKNIEYFVQKGVFMTPGLLIDGEVVSVGKVLSAAEIHKKIEEKL
ncbi:MAG: thioredoxin family protein [Desulfobacteraceae bacterium]|nr:MAG: thioredoxin family protein [Desulfobacteraceae bacterium]